MRVALVFILCAIGFLLLSSVASAQSAEKTTIVTTMEIQGEHTHYGDLFDVRATVTNIGSVPAENVIVHIEGVPPEWQWVITTPGDFTTIQPGQSASRVYSMTNQGGQPNILVWAWGPNTNTSYSSVIKLPINPLIIGGIILSMGGLFLVRKRTTKKRE